MARPARFDSDQVIEATTRVVAIHGPGGATIARIATDLGAPTGSIYHRFASRDILLGEVWLRAASDFQTSAQVKLAGADPLAAGISAVTFVPQWVRRNPERSRVMLLHRREDFLDQGWPPAMAARASELRATMNAQIRQYARRLTGRADKNTLRMLSFALAEAPVAAVRPHIETNQPPPPVVDQLLKATFIAITNLC